MCWSPDKGSAPWRFTQLDPLEFLVTHLGPGRALRCAEKAAYGVSRTRCFPGCGADKLQSNTLLLLRHPDTHCKVSTVPDNQNVCSRPPSRRHAEKHPAPLPFCLITPALSGTSWVAVLGPQELRALKNVWEAHGLFPMAVHADYKCHGLCL